MRDIDRLLAIADRLAPDVRKAFLAAVQALRSHLNLTALEHAILTKRVSTVEALLHLSDFDRDLQPAVSALRTIIEKSGALAAAQATKVLGVQLSFAATNPLAVHAAERLGATLVTEVSAQTRAAIRAAIARGIRQGIPPATLAQDIRLIVGLTEQQAMAVINYRFSLLQQNVSGERIATLAQRYATKLVRQRAVTIARTETIQALNAGQLALWRDAARKGLIGPDARKTWSVTKDDRLCPYCRPLSGQKRKLTETFKTGLGDVQQPPLHPRCRCTMVLSFGAQAQREAA